MLNVDSSRTGASEIAHEHFVRRGTLPWILSKNIEQSFGLGTQIGCREFLGVLLCLLGEYESPTHQSSSSEHCSMGVLSPAMIESVIPGTEWR